MKPKPKILIITPTPPYPLLTGGHKAQYYIIDRLRHIYNITLLIPNLKQNQLELLNNRWIDVNVISLEVEIYNSKVAPFFERVIRKIVLSGTKNRKNRYLGSFHAVWDSEFLAFIINHINKHHYDLIQCDFIPSINVAKFVSTNIKTLFVHHEIAFVCENRTLRTLDFLTSILMYFQYRRKRKTELNLLRQFKHLIVFSAVDKRILEKYLPNKDIQIAPFPVKIPDYQDYSFWSNHSTRKIVFLGGEVHYPNPDGVNWFLTKIWRKLSKRLSNIEFHIVGKWSEKFQAHCDVYERVVFPGFVEDLNDYLSGNIMIVPLRIGSGIRTKILEAFAYQVPVVTTSIGVEGIPVQDNLHCCVADSPQDFLYKIENLVYNAEKKKNLTDAAYSLVKANYDIDICVEQRRKVLDEVIKAHSIA